MNKNMIPKNIKASKFHFWRGISWIDVIIAILVIGFISLMVWGLPSLSTAGKIIISMLAVMLTLPLMFNWLAG
ncbi:hypothetical protein [Spiroplasma endosymbiont of Glossina fuscipes fuscipes]|uniref:hypothetical protein n=1 Tax=Spiroplasma endosymbiont of Glossina fuscipes fuscipes TaxID=2004463 RepID=UPI003C74785E